MGSRRWTAGDGELATTCTNGEARMSLKFVLAAALVLGVFGNVSAVSAETQGDREACTPDVHKICGEFIPNRDEIVKCLVKNKSKLSPACRVVMSRPYKPDQAKN